MIKFKSGLYLLLINLFCLNFSYAQDCNEQKPRSSRYKYTFVWPTDGWVQATDKYGSGKSHSGVADISIEHYAPIFASRSGTIQSVRPSTLGGLGISIRHESAYRTFYSHLTKSLVKQGQEVLQGQLIGYAGKMGNAYSPHVHFNISKNGDSVHIPELERGQWARAGRKIYLSPSDLSPESGLKSTYCVMSKNTTPTFSKANQNSVVKEDMLIQGNTYKVVNSYKGYLRIELPGKLYRYIPRNQTRFPQSIDTTVRLKKGTVLYDDNHLVYRKLTGNILLTRYQDPDCEDANYHCVVYRRFGDSENRLRKVNKSDVEHTPRMRVQIQSKDVGFRDNPSFGGKLLNFHKDPQRMGRVIVNDIKNGFYKIRLDGKDVWFPGWYTGGSL